MSKLLGTYSAEAFSVIVSFLEKTTKVLADEETRSRLRETRRPPNSRNSIPVAGEKVSGPNSVTLLELTDQVAVKAACLFGFLAEQGVWHRRTRLPLSQM